MPFNVTTGAAIIPPLEGFIFTANGVYLTKIPFLSLFWRMKTGIVLDIASSPEPTVAVTKSTLTP